jgi:hypothetical protein
MIAFANIQCPGGKMHFNLTNPNLIIGVVVLALIIVVGVALQVRNRRKTTAGFPQTLWI